MSICLQKRHVWPSSPLYKGLHLWLWSKWHYQVQNWPNGEFDSFKDPRDGTNSSKHLLLDVFDSMLVRDISQPVPAFFNKCSSENILPFKSNKNFQNTKAAIKNNVAASVKHWCLPNIIKHTSFLHWHQMLLCQVPETNHSLQSFPPKARFLTNHDSMLCGICFQTGLLFKGKPPTQDESIAETRWKFILYSHGK